MKPLRRRQLKNAHAEAAQFRARALLGFAVIALCLAVLAGWYFRLQVLQHDAYRVRSEANRIKPRPSVPGRGLIYDRAGRLLANNVPAYRLEVVPEQVADLPAALAALRRVVPISDQELEQFHAARRATPRGFRAIPLTLRLSEADAARFAVNRHRFPGIELVPYLTRNYPYGALFAHIIGYIGRLDADDLEALDDPKYAAFSHIGKTGLERYYEPQLRGELGYEYVEQNVEGRVLQTVSRDPAVPGADLRLTIDARLQQVMVDAFGDNDGAAVAVDPRSGEILAMVSLPAYDPNLFVNGISYADYATLTSNPSRPLFNRNVLGGGPPGSTVKPFVGLAGLESGLRTADARTLSTGEFRLPGLSRGYRDAHSGGHGWVDLRASIAQSVNSYYYQLAMDLGIERLAQAMRRYGFGRKTGIDLVGENVGVVPSPQWKRAHSREPWYLGETIIAGIGQGYWVATPLQLAQATAALADHGLRRRLHLVRAERHGFDAPWTPLPQPAAERITTDPAALVAVREGMVAAVHGPRGTARAIGAGAPYLIAGKTGTAQRVSRKGSVSLDPHQLPLHLRHQALFIAYAPADAPRIAIAVMVEHGGFGGTAAAPIARKVMDAWLLDDTASASGAPASTTPAAAAPVVAGAPRPDAVRAPAPPEHAAVADVADDSRGGQR